MSQSWFIVSGKGGVGKSMVCACLGQALARSQMSCCLVDTDIGLRSLDMLLGMENKVVYDVLDVARKDCKLKYALIGHSSNLSLLPAAQLGDLNDIRPADMERIVRKLKKRVAYVLMDAPAGVGCGIQNMLPAVDESILVVTPDDIAIRDAERVVALLEEAGKPRPMLIVNRVDPQMVARGEMYHPQTVAATLDVPLLGFVPEDRHVTAALSAHQNLMTIPCPAQEAMNRIAQRFLGNYVAMPSFPKKRLWPFGRK